MMVWDKTFYIPNQITMYMHYAEDHALGAYLTALWVGNIQNVWQHGQLYDWWQLICTLLSSTDIFKKM